MNLILLATISSFLLAFIPFTKKIIFENMEIIPFMILVSSIMIPILLTYCLVFKGKDETLKMFSSIDIKKIILLMLITSLLIIIGNYYKNYLYKTNNISKAEPLVIALTIIITILYGCLFFTMKYDQLPTDSFSDKMVLAFWEEGGNKKRKINSSCGSQ